MSGTVPTNRHCETKPGRDTAKNAGNCGLRVPHDLAPYMQALGNLTALTGLNGSRRRALCSATVPICSA